MSESESEQGAPLVGRKQHAGCRETVAAVIMQQLLRFGAWSQGFQRRSCRPRTIGGWDQPLAHYFERPGKPGDLLPPLVVLHGFSGDSRIMVATKC